VCDAAAKVADTNSVGANLRSGLARGFGEFRRVIRPVRIKDGRRAVRGYMVPSNNSLLAAKYFSIVWW